MSPLTRLHSQIFLRGSLSGEITEKKHNVFWKFTIFGQNGSKWVKITDFDGFSALTRPVELQHSILEVQRACGVTCECFKRFLMILGHCGAQNMPKWAKITHFEGSWRAKRALRAKRARSLSSERASEASSLAPPSAPWGRRPLNI